MTYEAVIFDLFGTLIDKFSELEHKECLRQMASVLSIPSDEFVRYWYDTFDERGAGVFQSLEANVEYICSSLGRDCGNEAIELAARINFDYTAASMAPRPHSVEVLSHLKEHGYRTGLVTNCSAEIPPIWEKMAFAPLTDVTVFSCAVGIQKPDRRIYDLAVKGLGVEPGDCLYIGDGDSRELTGAREAGLNPVLVRDPEEDRGNTHRVDYEGNTWDGPVILSLDEVIRLLK